MFDSISIQYIGNALIVTVSKRMQKSMRPVASITVPLGDGTFAEGVRKALSELGYEATDSSSEVRKSTQGS